MKKIFKNVYVVKNYGTFHELSYNLKQAKEYIASMNAKNAAEYYQIYKCDVVLKNVVPKNNSAKEYLNK